MIKPSKADDLKEILSQLPNLERLSLNSNNFWKLPRDMFAFNHNLKSISLHNNALTCLDGVFDRLIDEGILDRIRVTGNANGWEQDLRFRGADGMQQFKLLINDKLCE